jgi:hypothetical protein
MSRKDPLFEYLSALERARHDLDRAQKSRETAEDPIEKMRWSLEIEVGQTLVQGYQKLIKLVQETSPPRTGSS